MAACCAVPPLPASIVPHQLTAANENCDDCTGDVAVCTACAKGYKLEKSKCIEEKA